MPSPYQVLGLPDTATHDEVKRVYRRLALLYHPDRNNSPDAQEKFLLYTEAYEEIMKGRHSASSPFDFDFNSYFNSDEQLKRERRERAEKIAQKRYEDFKEETDAFKSSRYYYLVILAGALFFLGLVLLATGLMFYPIFLAFTGWSPFIILLCFVSMPLGMAIIYGIYTTFGSIQPYLRKKEEGYKTHLPSGKDFLYLFDINLNPFRVTRNTFFKLLLLIPLILSLLTIADYILPRENSAESVISDVITNVRNNDVQRIHTKNYTFYSPSDTLISTGEQVHLKITRILHLVTDIGLESENGEQKHIKYFPPHQSIYLASIFLPALLLFVSLFGFLSDNDAEINASLVISAAMLLIGYFFLI
jgi:hypothetical protein